MQEVTVPELIKDRIKARLNCEANLGKIIWVEQAEAGNWLVHAHSYKEYIDGANRVNDAGRFFALSGEIL